MASYFEKLNCNGTDCDHTMCPNCNKHFFDFEDFHQLDKDGVVVITCKCGASWTTDDVHLCNLCELSCVPAARDSFGDPHGLINAVVGGSYASTPGNGSGALDDMTAYKFSLCEWCLDWLFSQFHIPPKVYDFSTYFSREFEPAAQRVIEDEWRTFKDEFWAEKKKRDAARKKRMFKIKSGETLKVVLLEDGEVYGAQG